MKVLLDTHAFVWLATDHTLLSGPAHEAIAASDDGLFVSAISFLEIGLLLSRGRLHFPIDAQLYVKRACAQHGIEEVPLHGLDALNSTALPDLHRDPFDRILIELALRENMTVVSKDEQLARYPGVRVVW